jgi:outer membrane protein insertion porin family
MRAEAYRQKNADAPDSTCATLAYIDVRERNCFIELVRRGGFALSSRRNSSRNRPLEMRTSLLLAALALVSAAAQAQNKPAPAAKPAQGAGPAVGAPIVPVVPSGRAPERPAGLTAEQAQASVPLTGTIARIDVQGNRRVEADAVRTVLGATMKVGDAYDKEKNKAALLAIWKMGYFSDVRVDISPAPAPLEGYVLTVLLAEKPAINKIQTEGNDELTNDDLKDTIEIKTFQILDLEQVRKSAKKMQEKYIEKGYFLAEVSTKIDPLPNNEVAVIFQVNEHAKISVREVRFVGNHAISDAELKAAMITQEGNLFSFFTNSGTYREDAFQRDEIVLQGLYFDLGYIYVKFGKPAIELSPDKRYIYITMVIDEGVPFDVSKIDVGGDLIVDKSELLPLITTKPGQRFSKSRLQTDMNRLLDVYKDQGFAYANVTPDTAVDLNTRTVELTYNFQKGNLVTIEKIEIVGNTKTRDEVIRRELRIAEGQLFSGTRVRASKARVTSLGYFDNVEINQKRGSTDDKMVLEVSIKEKLTGTFQIGFGFTGGESFFAQAQLSQNNLLGYGHTASLSLQFSSIRQLFQISYSDPYLFGTQWTGAVDLYRSDLVYNGFERQANGGSLTAGYELSPIVPWLEDMRVFLTYTLEFVDVIASDQQTDLLANQFSSGRTSALRFSFNFDRRDNRLFPTKGFLSSAAAEFATSLLDSENLFQRYRLIQRFYQPLFWGLVFKTNLNLGYIRSTSSNRPVAISEKFFEGGINSIRGYSLRSISPTTPIAVVKEQDSGIVNFAIGGNKEFISNFEIEFPIVESAGVRGVVFYDAGNVFGDNESFFKSAQRNGDLPLGLFHSTGLGIRWFSPLGPLRFEVGFPLTRRESDDAYLFEFTIGNFF